ncbi:flagellar hook protein FlgE [Geodermatophilus sp. DF01-2]|uniref:flagellar hook protein FlgE n=1 Tax=Geodermatophilus sp. DF01-2 TaxID=2559610 RepID=UPI0010740879|nr:flagellar hook protein FlgE [Geodermatophilus sp. DF01_2]TFV54370.1 flagellar hook protein FlgE [Geodermatophilus sp. DF01_2]
MLRSMNSAISGLRAHQTKLDVTGNNIANVNTVGYKASQTVFEDTLSQVVRNGSAPSAEAGGTNPAQVGLGVKVAGITTSFEQGAAQNTGRSTDFMISGDGFFVTRAGNEQVYTRAGSFNYDAVGNLVTPDGALLQGWMAEDGVVDTNGAIETLTVPFGQVMQPTRTTTGAVVGNLSSSAATGTGVQTQITVYDAMGTAQQLTLAFSKTGDNTWDVVTTDAAGGTQTNTITFDTAPGQEGRPLTGQTFTFGPSSGVWPADITIDLADMRQFGGPSSLAPARIDGNAMGSLQSISLSGDGTVMGVYSNNLREPIGKLALATFANPGGLAKAGNSSYRVGDNSGQPAIGEPGAGGRGSLIAGALEMSNVDLAEEFTGLIVAQRGFQANSRVITSSDEILQDLVNLKR